MWCSCVRGEVGHVKRICGSVRLANRLGVRQPCRVSGENFSDAVLVVLGHGTTQNAASAAPVYQHAAELRRRNIFAGVREAFWKQEPQIKTVLAEIVAPRVFIVPLFISAGYFSDEVIPRELGFGPGLSTINSDKSRAGSQLSTEESEPPYVGCYAEAASQMLHRH
jgi:hypothetical protein